MTTQSVLLLAVFLLVLLALAWPLGLLLAKLGNGESVRGFRWLARIEHALYRLAGVKAETGMNWKTYALALLAFNALGTLFVYAVQRVQVWLPLNPQALTPATIFCATCHERTPTRCPADRR
jgi:K+-transporting ATPase ATPase A chain